VPDWRGCDHRGLFVSELGRSVRHWQARRFDAAEAGPGRPRHGSGEQPEQKTQGSLMWPMPPGPGIAVENRTTAAKPVKSSTNEGARPGERCSATSIEMARSKVRSSRMGLSRSQASSREPAIERAVRARHAVLIRAQAVARMLS
jgi:hypothetical protein